MSRLVGVVQIAGSVALLAVINGTVVFVSRILPYRGAVLLVTLMTVVDVAIFERRGN